jgi:hypothetical protein
MVVPTSEENIGFIITHIRKEKGVPEIEKQLRSAVKELSGIAFRLAEQHGINRYDADTGAWEWFEEIWEEFFNEDDE